LRCSLFSFGQPNQLGGPARGIKNTSTANDYAAINQGNSRTLPQPLYWNWMPTFRRSGRYPPRADQPLATPTSQTNDYAAVNLGQLKALAALSMTTYLRWLHDAVPVGELYKRANDYAMANIGQAKNLFSLI